MVLRETGGQLLLKPCHHKVFVYPAMIGFAGSWACRVDSNSDGTLGQSR